MAGCKSYPFNPFFFTKPLSSYDIRKIRLHIEINSTLTNNGSSKSDINIVNVSPIINFDIWSASPHSLVNWFFWIPYCDIAALNAVPGVTIWSSNTAVRDRTPNIVIDRCVHINLKSLSTRHFPFTVIQTVYFWITSDCERITFITNLKKIFYLETGFVKCWTIHIRGCQKFGFKVYWRIQFLGYLRTLSLKFQKARNKIEVVLTLPCWLSQFSWDS